VLSMLQWWEVDRQVCKEDECRHDGAQGALVSEHLSQCG